MEVWYIYSIKGWKFCTLWPIMGSHVDCHLLQTEACIRGLGDLLDYEYKNKMLGASLILYWLSRRALGSFLKSIICLVADSWLNNCSNYGFHFVERVLNSIKKYLNTHVKLISPLCQRSRSSWGNSYCSFQGSQLGKNDACSLLWQGT